MRPRELSLALLVALLASTCEAPSQLPASAQPATAPRARVLDPATVRVAPDAPAGRARAALDRGEPAAALALTRTALLEAGEFGEAGRLRWLAAVAAERVAGGRDGEGARDEARRHWEALAGVPHPLAAWARLRLAQWIAEGSPEAAAQLVGPLTQDWAGAGAARALEAVSLARAGRHEVAIPKLRALVAEAPARVGAATPGMPLAEILAASDDPAHREEALGLYRRVATRAPLAAVGREAQERAAQVLATLPEERRLALAEVPTADRLVRAEALYDATRYQQAEEELSALIGGIDDERSRCEARLLLGKAMYRRRDRDRAAEHLDRVARDCAAEDIRAWARYYAGRAFAQRGRHTDAIQQYSLLEQETPDHRLADDARFRGALSSLEAGDEAGMLERLRALPDEYPRGDMRGDARFMLAWRARAAGDLEEALRHLDASLAEGPSEDAEDVRGRVAYWRARTLADLGRREEAIAAYEALTTAWPLAYYAQQAVARLAELDPGRAEAVLGRWRAAEEPEPWTFPWRAELEAPGFQTALDLLRVGEVSLALEELGHLGALGEGADPDMLWLVASLLDAAGALPESSRLVRRRLGSFMRTAPRAEARHMWRLAYPRAFAPVIEEAARAEGVPPELVRSVAREESAFDPSAVSTAHAYGLIQLIEPTARRFARELDLPSDPVSLRRPEINVPIGARFIGFLWRRYDGNPAVLPAAYNAGEGAVDRWLRARPDQPLDEWIEDIPYDETRRYSRRVLQTWGVYTWLERGELPPLRRELPSR